MPQPTGLTGQKQTGQKQTGHELMTPRSPVAMLATQLQLDRQFLDPAARQGPRRDRSDRCHRSTCHRWRRSHRTNTRRPRPRYQAGQGVVRLRSQPRSTSNHQAARLDSPQAQRLMPERLQPLSWCLLQACRMQLWPTSRLHQGAATQCQAQPCRCHS